VRVDGELLQWLALDARDDTADELSPITVSEGTVLAF
jgi:hypothetical protein